MAGANVARVPVSIDLHYPPHLIYLIGSISLAFGLITLPVLGWRGGFLVLGGYALRGAAHWLNRRVYLPRGTDTPFPHKLFFEDLPWTGYR